MLIVVRFLLLLVASVTGAVPVWSQEPEKAKPSRAAAHESALNAKAAVLKKFLQDHVREIGTRFNALDDDETDRFSYAFTDLNGDGKDEAIIYLTGRGWCGTGGCQLYILTANGATYRFLARIPATRPPIRVLDRTEYGWHSVSMIVRDDATHVYEGELRFNGQKYPIGQRPVRRKVPGKVVISGHDTETPLFP
jgi:hypothetical protein